MYNDSHLEEGEKLSQADEAKIVLKRILDGMGVKASIESFRQNGRLVLNAICGPDDSIVIGRKGKTLEAIQLIVNRILLNQASDQEPLIIDINGYRERKRRNLIELAIRSSKRVKESGRRVIIGPLNAYERHIVHNAINDDPDVITESEGEGETKKIIFKTRHLEDQEAPRG